MFSSWAFKSAAASSSTCAIRLGSTFTNRATVGAGCYWGTEKFFRVDFSKRYPGVVAEGKVGFMGPPDATKNPSYFDVCMGFTKHVEVYDFTFNGDEETYENLIKFFYSFHDPTTLNRQEGDTGRQYASIIYVHDEVQRSIAEKVKAELQAYLSSPDTKRLPFEGTNVVTEIESATEFYPAQEDHQEYLDKNPDGYCSHYMRLKQWPVLPAAAAAAAADGGAGAASQL